MLRDDVVKLLAWRLGSRKNFTDRILAEMEYAQRSVLETNEWLPWFLETEMANTTTVAGDNRVALPDDFLLEIEEQHLWYVNSEGKELVLGKADYDFLQARYALTENGEPAHYALGSQFYIFPTPDAAYTLHLRYYAADTSMIIDNVETKWLKHASDLVIAAAGKELAEKHMQNETLATRYGNDLAKAWTRLLNKHIAMQEINQSRVAGSES
jgi:hypothetical protein